MIRTTSPATRSATYRHPLNQWVAIVVLFGFGTMVRLISQEIINGGIFISVQVRLLDPLIKSGRGNHELAPT
jgi:hypothetical protein